VATLILVHGAWHGGWCWERLVPLLEARGHRVLTPDLPGHDTADGAPSTTTLEDYGHTIASLANAQAERVVLVGHSMGGGVITQAAPFSSNLAGLIYVAAFIPQHGDSIAALAGAGEETPLNDHVELAPSGTHTQIEKGAGAVVFYGCCAPEDQEAAGRRLIPQAIQPLTDALEDPENRAAGTPAAGVVCLQDKAVDPGLQQEMCDARGIPTWDMDTDHSPFLSRPDELAEVIDKALKELGA